MTVHVPAPLTAGHPWAPWSPCGPRCLPGPGPQRPVARLVAVARLAGVGAVLGAGTLLAVAAPVIGARRVGEVQRRWASTLLAVAGVRVVRRGAGIPAGSLVVANHVSWLDVLVLATVAPVRLLAKREVRTWPLIGPMAARVGTVFLDRERLRTLPVAVASVAAVLRAGGIVAVFAEGTTRCGRSRGRFRPASFQAALDARAPVVPVALSYTGGGGQASFAAAFVGDDTLWSSVHRVAAAGGTTVRVEVLAAREPSAPEGPGRAAGRRELAGQVAADVERALAGAAVPRPAADAVAVSRAA